MCRRRHYSERTSVALLVPIEAAAGGERRHLRDTCETARDLRADELTPPAAPVDECAAARDRCASTWADGTVITFYDGFTGHVVSAA